MTPGIVYTHQNFTKAIDLKVINHNNTRYGGIHVSDPTRNHATNKRATAVHGEYVRHAKKIDQNFAATDPNAIGPCERALMDMHGCTSATTAR